jgi:hypothetical protein
MNCRRWSEDLFSDVNTGVFPTEEELREMDDFFSNVETGLGMIIIMDKVQMEMPNFELRYCLLYCPRYGRCRRFD